MASESYFFLPAAALPSPGPLSHVLLSRHVPLSIRLTNPKNLALIALTRNIFLFAILTEASFEALHVVSHGGQNLTFAHVREGSGFVNFK